MALDMKLVSFNNQNNHQLTFNPDLRGIAFQKARKYYSVDFCPVYVTKIKMKKMQYAWLKQFKKS